MGEMLFGIAADHETHQLNKLFGNSDDAARTALAQKIFDLRDSGEIPKLLNAPSSTNFPPNFRRQRSLRLAATELTRHINYRRLDPGRGNQREFLRWLTWLEKTEANWREAVKITKVLDYFVFRQQSGAVPPRVVFDWTEQAANLSVAVSPANYASTHPPRIDIMVSAPDAHHIDATSDED